MLIMHIKGALKMNVWVTCTPNYTINKLDFMFVTGQFSVQLLLVARPRLVIEYPFLTLTLPGPSAGVSGSLDSYCSLNFLMSRA